MMRTTSIAILATGLLTSAATAGSAPLAAPGDCAQPVGDFARSALYEQAGGVAGSPAEHFAPKGALDALGDATGSLGDAVGGPLGDITSDVGALGDAGASSLGDATAGAIGGAADGVGSTGGAAVGAVTDATGSLTDLVTSGLGGL